MGAWRTPRSAANGGAEQLLAPFQIGQGSGHKCAWIYLGGMTDPLQKENHRKERGFSTFSTFKAEVRLEIRFIAED